MVLSGEGGTFQNDQRKGYPILLTFINLINLKILTINFLHVKSNLHSHMPCRPKITYLTLQGHVKSLTAHSHDKSSDSGHKDHFIDDHGGHFGMKDKSSDRHQFDSDHESTISRHSKHKADHGASVFH